MKKLFGGINLTWPKVIIMAIVIGLYTGLMAWLPIARHTSFSDLAVTFEVWIFFGIFIIMNSKSNIDSALKCFVFFLISQPIVYLLQDVIDGSNLFNTYYRFWLLWTIATIPMGYIGYYMKKDKWWGLLILLPMLIFVGAEYSGYFSKMMYSFPRHILTNIFCVSTMIIYPLGIFNNKIARKGGLIISGMLIVIFTVLCILDPPVYRTQILSNNSEHPFDDTCSVSMDEKYGELSIKYIDEIEDWMIHADFTSTGDTEFVIECPDKAKQVFSLTIGNNTYDVVQK